LAGGLRSTMGYVGCATIEEMRRKPVMVRVTSAGSRESHVHDVQITREPPHYQGRCPMPEPMHDASRDIHGDRILILDLGAQYTQLIARRIRELGVFCEVWAWDHDPAE